jgi:hypothetical protein
VSYAQSYALAQRNAEACENATHEQCTCACGGRFHGKAHSAVFVAEYAARLNAEAEQRKQQPDLFAEPS